MYIPPPPPPSSLCEVLNEGKYEVKSTNMRLRGEDEAPKGGCGSEGRMRLREEDESLRVGRGSKGRMSLREEDEASREVGTVTDV
jgi:hypothetical protein